MSDEITKLLSHQQLSSIVKCHLHDDCSTEHSLYKLGIHTCYIVGAVLFNKKHEVLLIQEAKLSCRGTWYLPAGRVEPDETLVEAVKREVAEEAGLDFEPSGLICIEENFGRWMRFIFAGSVTGGSLKTTAKADAESLQAAWVKDPLAIKLRSRDILRIIDQAKIFYEDKENNPQQRKFAILPLLKALKTLYLRAFVICQLDVHSIHVLHWKDSTNGSCCIPVSCFKPNSTIKATLDELLHCCLSSESYQNWILKVEGILSLQHSGESSSEGDGMCLTVLVNIKHRDPTANNSVPTLASNHFMWHKISEGVIYEYFCTNENQKMQCTTLL